MDNNRLQLYVSLKGNDKWSGKLDEPNIVRTDGPFETIGRARDEVRKLLKSGKLEGMVEVWLREGCYHISEPLYFNLEDSAPVKYAAYPGENPVIDGGRRIFGWYKGKIGNIKLWIADIPEVKNGNWYFRQLFVNGKRRKRSRLPKIGWFQMQDVPGISVKASLFDGTDEFICKSGDIKNWRNLSDVEVIVFHWWCEERMPIERFDENNNMVKCSRRSMFALKEDRKESFSKYFVENAFEGLSEPGEWYLDRIDGKLFYVPMPGEEPDDVEIYAPVLDSILHIDGKPDEEKYVEFLKFSGLTFRHVDWHMASKGTLYMIGNNVDYKSVECSKTSSVTENFCMPVEKLASTPQAAFYIPGSISLKGARFCTIEDCKLEHIGIYAIELGEGCNSNHIVGNKIYDIGGGGIKLGGSGAEGPISKRTGNNFITDNHIHTCGCVFYSAAGILSMHSNGNIISHNHIHDLHYSGISCGWIWGYEENVSKNNRIEKNHIHNIGHGLLSDMGGIYTLGKQPGTVISGNVIHNINKASYGGWAIYLDEGSSYIITENNICYNADSQCFVQHYGRENIIRNNIFAFGKEGLVKLTRGEEEQISFTIERNIMVANNQAVFLNGYSGELEKKYFFSYMNLIWDISKTPIFYGNEKYIISAAYQPLKRVFTWDEWKNMGYDVCSILADPMFEDMINYDFTLKDNSPALNLGFKPIDTTDIGPRSKEKR